MIHLVQARFGRKGMAFSTTTWQVNHFFNSSDKAFLLYRHLLQTMILLCSLVPLQRHNNTFHQWPFAVWFPVRLYCQRFYISDYNRASWSLCRTLFCRVIFNLPIQSDPPKKAPSVSYQKNPDGSQSDSNRMPDLFSQNFQSCLGQ